MPTVPCAVLLACSGHVYRGWESLGVLTRCYDQSGQPADTGPLNPTINKTYEVIKGLYAEIQQVFAPEKFVHTGGDEVPFDCWTSNPQIKKWMSENSGTVKNFADLETLYEQRLIGILDNQNTSYIVWQELFDNGAKLAKDTVIDVWKGGNWQEEMSKVSAAGFHSVLSAPFYLNYISCTMHHASCTHSRLGCPSERIFAPVSSWRHLADFSFCAYRWPRLAEVLLD